VRDYISLRFKVKVYRVIKVAASINIINITGGKYSSIAEF